MSLCSSLSSPRCFTKPTTTVSVVTSRFRASADVPDFLSADWLESRKKRPFGPRLNFSAEEAVQHQLDALKYNDQPRHDYGIEVMYRFAGFDPFERSTYFGPFFDLGQFERFRRIFHHSTYRVLLGHKDRKILSSLFVKENRFKLRIWIRGSRPEEEEIFQFTMVQVYNALGVCYVRDGKLEKGITQFETAVRLQPGYVTAWNNLGDAYENKKDYKSALKAFEEVLLFDPNNKVARPRRDTLKEREKMYEGVSVKSKDR